MKTGLIIPSSNITMEVDTPDAEGVFISCTNFRTLEVVARLEKELQKPVVSSNTATFWALMRMRKIDLKKGLKRYGQLLA